MIKALLIGSLLLAGAPAQAETWQQFRVGFLSGFGEYIDMASVVTVRDITYFNIGMRRQPYGGPQVTNSTSADCKERIYNNIYVPTIKAAKEDIHDMDFVYRANKILNLVCPKGTIGFDDFE